MIVWALLFDPIWLAWVFILFATGAAFYLIHRHGILRFARRTVGLETECKAVFEKTFYCSLVGGSVLSAGVFFYTYQLGLERVAPRVDEAYRKLLTHRAEARPPKRSLSGVTASETFDVLHAMAGVRSFRLNGETGIDQPSILYTTPDFDEARANRAIAKGELLYLAAFAKDGYVVPSIFAPEFAASGRLVHQQTMTFLLVLIVLSVLEASVVLATLRSALNFILVRVRARN